MNTYTYFAQAIVNVTTRKVEEYELLLRAWSPQDRDWYLPETFDISVGMQTRMLKEALKNLDVQRVSINLTPEQFASRSVVQRLARFVKQTPRLAQLTVELTAAPTVEELTTMGPEYHQHQMLIALDDVGSDIDDIGLVEQLAPGVDSFKFALQNLREQGETADLLGRVQPWADLAHAHDIQFTVEGVETYADLQLARSVGASHAQGFFFNHPTSPNQRNERAFAQQISNLNDLI
ncbi:EAL domain-containing protein [Lacticaseibacillus thailandensis]|uniref:EAL domain-containing protein n=1 Tax=Lacticaseibacillus thailandensis TaxID=381741 RepID=UPI0006D0F0B8|nr:EAL domain-containing protein [Lacticaseibacillus thailandensis]